MSQKILLSDILRNFYEIFQDEIEFGNGLFSRRISLDYHLSGGQPWVNFDAVGKPKLSFRAHEIQFLEKDNANPWIHAAIREETAEFKGFLDLGYYIGSGSLRGYMKLPERNYRAGFVVNSGRVVKLRTMEEMVESKAPFIAALMETFSPDLKKSIN